MPGVQTLMDTKPIRRKKADEDADAARLKEELALFEEEFGETSGVETLKPKSFIRMDIVNANKSVGDLKPSLYKPSLPNPLLERSKKSSLPSSTPISSPSTAASAIFEDAKRKAAERARKMMEDAHRGKEGPAPTVVVPSTSLPVNRPPRPGTVKAKEIQSSKTRNLDAFKEELKRMQAERDTRKTVRDHLKNELGVDQAHIDLVAPPMENPYTGTTSSDIDDNSITTNIYIGNLPLSVTMSDLLETFGTYGPLASGKILYPRPEDERKRDYLCGFIAYMHRKDFDRAFTQLPGLMIRGETVKISYARQVQIPPVPFHIPPALEKLSFPDPPTGLPFNAMPRSSDLREYLSKWKDLPKLGGSPPENEEELADYKKMMKNATIRVVIPTDSSLLHVIHRCIEFVVREGPLFEAILMTREATNPLFRFLFDNHHPAHVYYRWKLYSVLQGERPHLWRRDRFRMFDEGSWWQPPIPTIELNRQGQMPESLYHTAFSVAEQRMKLGFVDKERIWDRGESVRRKPTRPRSSSPSEKESRKEKKKYMSSRDRDKLEDMLRDLTPERDSIGIAMLWCVEHAAWSNEIADCLYESLTIGDTPLHKKIARLYLIADILANAAVRGVKDVFYFRQHFESLFPKIFDALRTCLSTIESRLKAEQFKQRVMSCFRAWEDNTLYPTEMLIHCQNVFLGLIDLHEKEQNEDIDGDDLDGAPIEEDLDGVPLNNTNTVTASKWNTVDEKETDNEEDVDGVSIDDTSLPSSHSNSTFKPMQWNNVSDGGPSAKRSKWEEAEGEEEKEKRSKLSPIRRDDKNDPIFGDIGEEEEEEEKNNEDTKTVVMSDERRRLMREIEVKVIALQDELEKDGESDWKKKVDKYRSELMRKMEEKLGKEKKKEKKEKNKKERKRSRSREREKDREKEKEREREREKERKRSRSRSRDRRRDRSRSRDRKDRDSRRERKSRSRSRERRRR